MSQLKVKVANSLKSLLARLGKQQESEPVKPAEQDLSNQGITVPTSTA